jgi:CheY-like chemotaxis protein
MWEESVRSGRPISVLLVDDRPAAFGELDAALAPLRLKVVSVEPGADVNVAFQRHEIVVAFIGVYAEAADPIAAVEQVRHACGSRYVPTIFLADSGATSLTPAQAYGAGAADYIVRPIASDILRSKVAGFVKLSRQAKERVARLRGQHDRCLSTLSHELELPLAPILTSLASLEQAGFDDARSIEAIWRIGRRVRHFAQLIQELREVSYLSSDLAELKPEPLDLAWLVRIVAEDRRATLEQNNLHLCIVTCSAPVWISADRTRMIQVIDNLIDVAARHCPTGRQIRIAVESDSNTVSTTLRVSDAALGTDSGIDDGFSSAYHDAKPRFDGLQTDSELSLAVVRCVIESLGGTVTLAHAGPGHGAETIVMLPGDTAPPALSAINDAVEEPACKRRVLIVEDNKDAAMSLSVLLQLMGHDVRVAYSGPEAVELAAEWVPEITISDIGLPGFDGFEVARQLRGRFGRAPLLVALTGYGRDEDRRQSHEAGFDHHLVKPADPAELQRMLTTTR